MVYGILIAIIILLFIGLIIISQEKIQEIKNQQEIELNVRDLKNTRDKLLEDIENCNRKISNYQNKILEVQTKYRQELDKKTEDLNIYFENQKQLRQSEMDTDFDRLLRERQENLNNKYLQLEQDLAEKEEIALEESEKTLAAIKENRDNIVADTLNQQKRYEALLEPLRQYEREQQERLFYTIQVPDEYKEDIDFLITTVSQKVQHPDIINKLIWSEYVKPYLDQTFKRIQIEEKPGIYKLTNLDSGKCYIGKSTNVKKRITDHFKSSIGISTIANQAVHHEIWKTGFWNWTIEIIIYCDKEQLSDLEKYYISFFKSNEFGYNKTGGGEG